MKQQSTELNTPEEYEAWDQRCDEFIESLEEQSQIKRPRLSNGKTQSVVALITRLKNLKSSVRERFVPDVDAGPSEKLRWREINTAFKSRIQTGKITNVNHIEPRHFLEDAREIVVERIRCVMEEHGNLKVNTIFNGEFVVGDKIENRSIATKNCELFGATHLEEWYKSSIVERTLTLFEEFQERDSGWTLKRILNLTVNINKYNPLHAGCDIQIPREIQMKRAVINVKSEDNACFAWSVVAALNPVEHNAHLTSSYPDYSEVLELADIEFPMTLTQIKKFESLNNISIHVYCIEKEEKKLSIVPYRLADKIMDKHIHLLYLQDDDEEVGHFAWIKNLSRLVSSQINKKNGKKYFCNR